jgi:hypothetical protein
MILEQAKYRLDGQTVIAGRSGKGHRDSQRIENFEEQFGALSRDIVK